TTTRDAATGTAARDAATGTGTHGVLGTVCHGRAVDPVQHAMELHAGWHRREEWLDTIGPFGLPGELEV
ncbi:MAG: hypothetical protein IVW55_16450, partial [Chloroflexi bacterium]|nr:hypothetical protein [Chloroflexota bacterium]